MDEKNLDIHGSAPIPWSRPLEQLRAFEAGPGASTWLATTRPDVRPHLAGIGALSRRRRPVLARRVALVCRCAPHDS